MPAVLELSGEQCERLHEAFVSAFPDQSDLKRLVLFVSSKPLAVHVEPGKLADMIYELLFEVAQPEGWLKELVEKAAKKRPDIRKIANEFGWTGDALGSETPLASPTLPPLGDLLADPVVRDAVVNAGARLRDARDRLREVADSKDLHDLLHSLQHRIYGPLLEAGTRFPEGNTGIELRLHILRLEQLRKDCAQLLTRESFSTGIDCSCIPEELDVAIVALKAAVAEGATEKLRQGAKAIRGVLELRLSLANQMILQAVRSLPLTNLIKVFQELPEPALSAMKTWTLGLEGVLSVMKERVSQHKLWQRIDSQIRLLEVTVGGTSDEVRPAWNQLAAQLAEARAQSREAWAESLEQAAAFMTTSVETGALSAVRIYFVEIRALAGDRFRWVDDSLKEGCQPLREIGAQVDTLLEAFR